MEEKSNGRPSRRDVLRKSAAVGMAGLGASGVAAGSAAASDAKIAKADGAATLKRLRAENVVLNAETLDRLDTDVALPDAEVREGQRLFERLSADGLIATPSFDAFPDYDRARTTEGNLYRIDKDGQHQVAFTTSTPKGRLQVTFTERSIPSAALFPEDGGSVILYTAPDGENYRRIESDLTVAGSSLAADTCDSSSCSGCSCDDDWCFWSTDATKCLSCNGDDCIVTDSCGC